MELKAERVDQLNCGKCGQAVDPAQHRPLANVDCPQCKHRLTVPARFGDFLLTAIVGSGAAGVVCKALDPVLHRQVAVKILKTGDDAAQLVEACTREARALAALNSPHVVQVYNIGAFRDQHYIVMELLDGGSVEKALVGKQAPEAQTLDIAIDVAQGLEAAARIGLVHMDVKPANILFDRHGHAKLIDFGVAHFIRRSNDQIIGTPYYVAPEVVRGQPASRSADIYSLGATLFHLLAGRPPFTGRDVTEVIRKRLCSTAPDLLTIRSDLTPATAAVLARMLQRDPAERYTDYADLLRDLRAARDQTDLPAHDQAIGELASACMEAPAKSTAAHTTAQCAAGVPSTGSRPRRVKSARTSSSLWLIPIAAAVLGILGLIWYFSGQAIDPVPLDPAAGAVHSASKH